MSNAKITLTLSVSFTTALSADQLRAQAMLLLAPAIEAAMVDAGALNSLDIDHVAVTDEEKPSRLGTSFQHGKNWILVELDDDGLITDAWMEETDCRCTPVAEITELARYVQLERQGRRVPVFTDHDEEPSEIVYLATSTRWDEAKLITDIDTLEATMNDPTITSFVQLSMETSYL